MAAAGRGVGESLWEHWPEVAARLGGGPLLACFDYDGTLVPIRPTPEEAVADAGTLGLLGRVAALPGVRLAVVSGRRAAALAELLPVAGLWRIGLHGFETVAPDGDPASLRDLAACAAELAPLRRHAEAIAARHPGARVEAKGAAIALHTRLASRDDAAAAGAAFRAAAERLAGFSLMTGKEVLEVRPAGAHKGAAVDRLSRAGEAVLYAGDDVTDEDAFAALAGDPAAVTVRVGGPHPTAARYRLEEQVEVAELLARLIALRERSTP